jgi:hypothetical protein
MAEKDLLSGWGDVPLTADLMWKCPECGEKSPIEDWYETEVYCEMCGDHDARGCPKCDELYDHVWGEESLVNAQAATS